MQGALSLDEKNRDVSIHLISVLSLVHMSEPRFRPDSDESSKEVVTFPLLSVQQGPMRLHSGAMVAPRKFHGVSNALQV